LASEKAITSFLPYFFIIINSECQILNSYVKRTHSWMNRFRGILIGWNKKPRNYVAMLYMAFALIIYRKLGFFG